MRRTQTVLALALVPVAALSMSGCRSSGAEATTTKDGNPQVQIMVGGIDKVIYLPAKLTEQLGYLPVRAAVLNRPGEVEVVERPAPSPGPHEVLVRVRATS
jgi:hypothetical protein